MFTLRPGLRVRVKNIVIGSIIITPYHRDNFSTGMEDSIGKIYIINYVNGDWAHIILKDRGYHYHISWLEPVNGVLLCS